MSNFDSTSDTLDHIGKVQGYIADKVIKNFEDRAKAHDASKLEGVEKEGYDKLGERLRGITYGSQEYKDQFKDPAMKAAVKHHYENNTHHPEHFLKEGESTRDGRAIAQMSLFDLLEMVVDWKAASERHADGSVRDSLPINEDRFGMSLQLASIIERTVEELGW